MDILKSKISSKDVVTGSRQVTPDEAELRSLVKTVYEVDENVIDALTEKELYDTYGDDFKRNEDVVEHQTGQKVYLGPGLGALASQMRSFKADCEARGVKFWSFGSEMVNIPDEGHFGEAIIIEISDEHWEVVQSVIKEEYSY